MNSIRTSLLLTVAAAAAWASPQVAATPDPAALASRAVQLQASGDYAGAAEAYRQLLKIAPNDVATHVNLGVVLVNTGRYDEALAEYEAAEKLLPGDPRIALNIALAYEKSGRIKSAADRFVALHAVSPDDPKVTMLLADCNLQLGNDTRVIALLQPLHAQTPDDLGIVYMLGMALLRTHQNEAGEKLLDQILRNGDTAESRFLMGVRIFESHDYPAAVKQFQSAIELNPNLPGLQALYGMSLLNTGDPDAAALAFRKELATDANSYEANLGLAQILQARKQLQQATPLFEHALLLRPGSPHAELGIAECLLNSGRFQQARPHAENAVAALPDSTQAHAALYSVYSGLGMTAEASTQRQKMQSLAALASGHDHGPKLNDAAPDFELAESTSGRKIRLSNYAASRPVVVVFGSYSCPNLRSSAQALASMREHYGDNVSFLLVYIREAHSSDQWQSTRNERDGIHLAPASTMTQKEDHARMCSRKLHLNFPAVVDSLDGSTEAAYNAWPSRAFIIGVDRRVLYSTRLTELDFHADQMEAVLKQVATRGKQP